MNKIFFLIFIKRKWTNISLNPMVDIYSANKRSFIFSKSYKNFPFIKYIIYFSTCFSFSWKMISWHKIFFHIFFFTFIMFPFSHKCFKLLFPKIMETGINFVGCDIIERYYKIHHDLYAISKYKRHRIRPCFHSSKSSLLFYS